MSNLRIEAPRNHHVSVRYGDGFHSFRLARGATLGELAVRIGGLDGLHDGAPLTIEIAVEPQLLRVLPATLDNTQPH